MAGLLKKRPGIRRGKEAKHCRDFCRDTALERRVIAGNPYNSDKVRIPQGLKTEQHRAIMSDAEQGKFLAVNRRPW
jgi:hypothetical protein